MAIYSVGIDLGTTNSSLSWIDRRQSKTERKIGDLPVPQLISEGEIASRFLLPSFIFIPKDYEVSEGDLALPWNGGLDYAAGELGRKRSISDAARVVSSAKSWLGYGRVDRRAPILPWAGGDDLEKISPVEASSRYLLHLKEAWNAAFAAGDDACRLERQDVVLTVPASFDEEARELTLAAAYEAGLGNPVLLEEPQAAFYSWIASREGEWKRRLKDVSLILVCDIGGGTTDFTLIEVSSGEEDMALRRIAVGDHILLGGDNMDLALARYIESQKFQGKLDAAGWALLCGECRQAKEKLLSGGGSGDFYPITIVGRGSRLIGGTVQTGLERGEVDRIILEGFFPESAGDAGEKVRASAAAGGLQEMGLPYERDPAVTRHLAAFLNTHLKDGRFPDAVMFNGGVFMPQSIRSRLTAQLERWSERPVRLLDSSGLELAVSRGAAYFGLARSGEGVRIGGGSPRSYYVNIDLSESSSGTGALCLIPRDLMTETVQEIGEREFSAVLNRPVGFSLYSSTSRPQDVAGDILPMPNEALRAVAPVFTVLRSAGGEQEKPVHLKAWLTEIGTLEFWCVSEGQQWKLNFGVGRGEEEEPPPAAAVSEDPARSRAAHEAIASAFGRKPSSSAEGVRPRGLMAALEDISGRRRDDWSVSYSRMVFDTLLEVKNCRRKDERYEAAWFNMAGFTLRPGFGFPLDDWRMEQTREILEKWLQFNRDPQGRLEWWIFWRRCAGGLDAGSQQLLFERISPWLFSGKKHIKTFSGPQPSGAELLEVLRMASVLERLPTDEKVLLGEYVMNRLKGHAGVRDYYWLIARIGGRVPFAGPVNLVVPAARAEAWIRRILDGGAAGDSQFMALSRLARLTGDRMLDIDDGLRGEVVGFLEKAGADDSYVRPLRETVRDELVQQTQVFGESLPPGLILRQELFAR